MNKYYKISEKKLKKLIENDWTLLDLEANGVDNWGGYEEIEEINEQEVIKFIEETFEVIE